jgi:hypothetical protein
VGERTRISAVGGVATTGRAIAVTLACVACAGLIGACGSTTEKTTYLDVGRVERSIERSILAERNLLATVVCPTRVVQRPGKFPCIATTVSAKKPHKSVKTPFLVTIHNDKGYVTYIGK